MGLAARRLASEFQSKFFPALKERIDAAAGFPVEMEVRWDTILNNDERFMHQWLEGWPNVYFEPIVHGLKRICIDDMGKEALRGALKKVIVQNTKESYSSDWARFDSGVLTLDCQFSNLNDVQPRAERIIKALEEGL
jgi:hypothetical protein